MSQLQPYAFHTPIEAIYQRGMDRGELGRYDLAIQDFTEALALDPQYAKAYCERGHVYLLLYEFDRAIAGLDRAFDDLTRAIALDSQNARAFVFRSGVQLLKDQPELAVQDATEAIAKLDESSPILLANAHSMRATAYSDMGRYHLALQDCRHIAEFYTLKIDMDDGLGILRAVNFIAYQAVISLGDDLAPNVATAEDLQQNKEEILAEIRMLATSLDSVTEVFQEGVDRSAIVAEDNAGRLIEQLNKVQTVLTNQPAADTPTLDLPTGDRLTAAEKNTLIYMAAGFTNPQIAEALIVKRETIDGYTKNVMSKLSAPTRTAAAIIAVDLGLFSQGERKKIRQMINERNHERG